MAFVNGSSRTLLTPEEERKGDKKAFAMLGVVLAISGGILASTFYHANKRADERNAKRADPNFPQLSIERNLEDVQKADGRVERIVKTPKGIEYVLRDCDSRFNPKPSDIDGPYNPSDIEIVCMYDLEGERSYIGALERAEEIYDREKEREKIK